MEGEVPGAHQRFNKGSLQWFLFLRAEFSESCCLPGLLVLHWVLRQVLGQPSHLCSCPVWSSHRPPSSLQCEARPLWFWASSAHLLTARCLGPASTSAELVLPSPAYGASPAAVVYILPATLVFRPRVRPHSGTGLRLPVCQHPADSPVSEGLALC